MFCPKCGAKLIDGAAFCQKCGAKTEVFHAPNATENVQSSSPIKPQVSYNAPDVSSMGQKAQKGNSRIAIFLVAGLVAVAAIIGIIFFVQKGRNEQPGGAIANTSDATEVALTETYTDEENGLSFRYPADWSLDDDEDSVVALTAMDAEQNIQALFYISKDIADVDLLEYTGDDFNEIWLSVEDLSDDITIESVNDVFLGDSFAKKVSYTYNMDGEKFLITQYLYNYNGFLYGVNYGCRDSDIDIYDPIFSAVMDSYVVSETSSAPQEKDMGWNIPLEVSTDAMNLFSEWAEAHPLIGEYHLDLISDDDTDDEGNKIFLFTFTGDAGVFNMSIRKSDGYMEYIYKFGAISMDEWYESMEQSDDSNYGLPSDINYHGASITDWIGQSSEILGILPDGIIPVYEGESDYGEEFFYYDNGNITVVVEDGQIMRILGDASAVDINGVTLDKTRAELVDVLGTPANEWYGDSDFYVAYVYTMEYITDNGVSVLLEMADEDTPADSIIILPEDFA